MGSGLHRSGRHERDMEQVGYKESNFGGGRFCSCGDFLFDDSGHLGSFAVSQ